MKSITDEVGFIQITIPLGAFEIESLNKEIKWIIIDKRHFTEANYSFTIKPNFSTLGPTKEISPQGPIISFMFDVNIRDRLGFSAVTMDEDYNISPNPVDILSTDNIFLECDIAIGMIFKSKRSGIIHIWTMKVIPGYKNVEKFAGRISWYMMDTKDFVLSISFRVKNENGNLVSINGQSITFRLSIKEVWSF